MAEMWLPVEGFEGVYEVSSRGRVRSLDRTIVTRTGVKKRRRGAIKGTFLDPVSGYCRVNLGDGSRSGLVRKVHQLVAEAFLGPRPAGMIVRHINGNSTDNRARNLSYGTSLENALDTVAHGRNLNAVKTYCAYGHVLLPPNLVESGTKGKGHRSCRACHRARARVAHWRRHGVELDHRTVSDAYYRDAQLDLGALGVPPELLHGVVGKRSNQHQNKPKCVRGHPLREPNLDVGQARRGVRACKACHRARAQVQRHARAGRILDMQQASDAILIKIMAGS